MCVQPQFEEEGRRLAGPGIDVVLPFIPLIERVSSEHMHLTA